VKTFSLADSGWEKRGKRQISDGKSREKGKRKKSVSGRCLGSVKGEVRKEGEGTVDEAGTMKKTAAKEESWSAFTVHKEKKKKKGGALDGFRVSAAGKEKRIVWGGRFRSTRDKAGTRMSQEKKGEGGMAISYSPT